MNTQNKFSNAGPVNTMPLNGIDVCVRNPHLLENLGRVGVVTNQSACTANFEPVANALERIFAKSKTSNLSAVFGPQHGYFQTEQDNMFETPHMEWSPGIPLFSLYSETRIPTDEQLKNIDTLVVDMVDVGCRIYTYMLTLAGCLQAAAKLGKKVIVLDRPNPLGLKKTEGNLLNLRWKSFVGWYEIPMRHGLTMGELGRYFLHCDKLTCDYRVIEVENLSVHTTLKTLSEIPWIMPSPNLPHWLSSFFFPSFVSLETTNISEGRGSTTPFQLVGAPFLNAGKCLEFLNEVCNLSKFGIAARQHNFRPTFNKHKGVVCNGISFHIENFEKAEELNLFELGIWFLAFTASEEHFEWKEPGYEYNFTDAPVNLVLGHENWLNFMNTIKTSDNKKTTLSNAKIFDKLKTLLEWSQTEASLFAQNTKQFHIYSRGA